MSIMKLNSLLLLSLLIVACDQSSNPVTDPQQSDLTTETIIDIDQDGYPAADDCDDNNQLVHVLKTFFTDSDLDGYGSLAET